MQHLKDFLENNDIDSSGQIIKKNIFDIWSSFRLKDSQGKCDEYFISFPLSSVQYIAMSMSCPKPGLLTNLKI